MSTPNPVVGAAASKVPRFRMGEGPPPALLLILVLKRWPHVPSMLVAIVVSTVAVAVFGLDRDHGVSVLGTLPQGLPGRHRPRTSSTAASLCQLIR